MHQKKQAWFGTGVAIVTSGLAYAWYYFTEAVKPPKLYYLPGEISRQILDLCTSLRQPYRPTPWALNTHLQTMIGYLRLASIRGSYRRQLLQANDDGTVALDWFDGCDAWSYAPPDTPILLVMHGINGGSHEGYCKWACAAAMSKGWRAVVLNYRGCNGLQLTSPRGYYATLTGDVRVALDSVKSRFPSAPVSAVGYSLGSIMLTKYVAEADQGMHGWQGGSGLVAAAMVSNPVCLKGTSDNLSNRWSPSYLYNLALAYKLKEYCRTHQDFIAHNTRVDLDAVMEAWTVGEVEDLTLFKSVGFTRDEYHRQASSQYHIANIRTPSLFLVSEDDPFLGQLPVAECSLNPYTILAVTQLGGHVAFLTGFWPFKLSWMDQVVVEFMQTNLQIREAKLRETAVGNTKLSEVAAGREASGMGQAPVILERSEDMSEVAQAAVVWETSEDENDGGNVMGFTVVSESSEEAGYREAAAAGNEVREVLVHVGLREDISMAQEAPPLAVETSEGLNEAVELQAGVETSEGMHEEMTGAQEVQVRSEISEGHGEVSEVEVHEEIGGGLGGNMNGDSSEGIGDMVGDMDGVMSGGKSGGMIGGVSGGMSEDQEAPVSMEMAGGIGASGQLMRGQTRGGLAEIDCLQGGSRIAEVAGGIRSRM